MAWSCSGCEWAPPSVITKCAANHCVSCIEIVSAYMSAVYMYVCVCVCVCVCTCMCVGTRSPLSLKPLVIAKLGDQEWVVFGNRRLKAMQDASRRGLHDPCVPCAGIRHKTSSNAPASFALQCFWKVWHEILYKSNSIDSLESNNGTFAINISSG